MTQRFIVLKDSEETQFLLEHYPNAFLLLSLIAMRARIFNGHPDGFEIGEAHIGDYKKAGIETEGKYRQALKILILNKFVEKVETCRTREKFSPGKSTFGTKVKIINSKVFDIHTQKSIFE